LFAYLGEGIRIGTEQVKKINGARPGIAQQIMVVFTDGWQNKGPCEPDLINYI
jgi:hypothetical protein